MKPFLCAKPFLGALLVLAFGYVTFFALLENPLLAESTASLVGVRHPALFLVWLIVNGAALFFNCQAMYQTYQCHSRVGRGAIWLALCAQPVIFLFHGKWVGGEVVFGGATKAIHWAATIVFMLGYAAAVGILFFHARRQSPRFKAMLVCVGAVVAGMLAVFFTLGKSGLFEAVPLWVIFILLFLVNCTGIFVPQKVAIDKA